MSDAGTNTGTNTGGDGGAAGTGGGAGSTTSAAAATTGTPPPGGGAGEFLALLPEDIRGEVYFKDVKDVPALATKAFHQSKLIGRLGNPDSLVAIPGPDDADGWATVWNRLGRPEAADKYALADPENLPEGLSLNPESKTEFAKRAHELGLTQKQAEALYQASNARDIQRFSAAIAEVKAGIEAVDAALKSEWGQAYEQKDRQMRAGIAHLAETLKIDRDELEGAIDATPGERGVAIKKVFAELGRRMVEDGVIGKGGSSAGGALSPAEAQQQIAALQMDPQFMKAYGDRHAPGHAEAVQKMLALHEYLVPQNEAA